LPDLPLASLGQDKFYRLVVGVQQDQPGIILDRLAALVHVAYEVARQTDAQALNEAPLPVFVRHLFARRLEERDIRDARSAQRSSLEKLATLEDGVLAPDPANLLCELQESLLTLV